MLTSPLPIMKPIPTRRHAAYLLLWAAVVPLSACFDSHGEEHEAALSLAAGQLAHPISKTSGTDEALQQRFQVPPPPFTKGLFPCSTCHHEDYPANPERRELEIFHADIDLDHDEGNRWCLDCHDADDRDMLHLANGSKFPFEESYRLCGQCHGTKYRDWKAGVHGKRTGSWDGEKTYLLCVHCHDAHSPRFKAIHPMPAPIRPEDLGQGEEQ